MASVKTKAAELTALKLMKAHEHLESRHTDTFKSHGLSAPQYNVLRILRGARGEGLSCHEMGNRMLKRVPDVTRLLDRLEKRDLISRCRDEDDRRVVRTAITDAGLALLAEIDKPLRAVIQKQFRNFDDTRLRQLDSLLDDLLAD